jgi:hypothetical protein
MHEHSTPCVLKTHACRRRHLLINLLFGRQTAAYMSAGTFSCVQTGATQCSTRALGGTRLPAAESASTHARRRLAAAATQHALPDSYLSALDAQL